MVSELLQDRPRLVKQMGSVIFILVYKWIFKFPLGYLNYHQESIPEVPIQPEVHPGEAFPQGSWCGFFLWPFTGAALPVMKLSWISARSGPTLCAPGSVSGAWHSPGSSLSHPVPAARQSSVQCWKSRCRRLRASCRAARPPLLVSSLNSFCPLH